MRTRRVLDRRKRVGALAAIGFVLLAGCNANESKEGRLRKLEAESRDAAARLEALERRVEELEARSQDHVE